MTSRFPEDVTTHEKARGAGIARAAVAEEWADYLEDTGRTYNVLDC